jgi:hypothetical protein
MIAIHMGPFPSEHDFAPEGQGRIQRFGDDQSFSRPLCLTIVRHQPVQEHTGNSRGKHLDFAELTKRSRDVACRGGLVGLGELTNRFVEQEYRKRRDARHGRNLDRLDRSRAPGWHRWRLRGKCRRTNHDTDGGDR